MDMLREKQKKLEAYLHELGSVAVAFSSGVDSTFLLKTAQNVLSDNVIAVTAKSCSFPERELNEAITFCKEEGYQACRHRIRGAFYRWLQAESEKSLLSL